MLIALTSTVVLFVVVGVAVVNSTGWPAVKQSFFNGYYFRTSFTEVLDAFWLNVKIFSVAEVAILIVALGIAVLRGLPGPVFFPLRLLAVVYTDLFRGIPTILVIYILGFGVPALQLSGVPNSAVFWGTVALVLVYSAYVAEVYRAGIESVHPSQEAAARSLGLSRGQSLRYVILPQAVRRVLPPLLNDFIGLQKDTALVGLLGPVEAFEASNIAVQSSIQLHPVLRRRAALHRIDDPACALHRLVGGPPAAPPADGPGGVSTLVLEQVHKSFGENEVLKGIDLNVADHEVVCLIGASGSGKSTLLRCVNLIERIDSGRIMVGDQEVTAPGVDLNRLRREIGIVYQSYNLFPHMTVIENVSLAPRKALKVSRGDAKAAGLELLERFGLADKAAAYPDHLSGGQQQRVAIVRALAMKPGLMLLDEITSALDPELVAEVLQVVRELAAEGMTMVIATHEMGFARDVANRVCFLDAGVILEQGPPDAIFRDPQEPRTQQFLQRIIDAGRMQAT